MKNKNLILISGIALLSNAVNTNNKKKNLVNKSLKPSACRNWEKLYIDGAWLIKPCGGTTPNFDINRKDYNNCVSVGQNTYRYNCY